MTDKKDKQNIGKAVKADVSNNELLTEIKEKKKKILDLKIDFRLGKLKNPHEINILRKEIARLATKLNLKKFIKK